MPHSFAAKRRKSPLRHACAQYTDHEDYTLRTMSTRPSPAAAEVAYEIVDDISLDKSAGKADEISPELLDESLVSFESDPKNLFAQNAVTRTDVTELLIDREESKISHHFSSSLRESLGFEQIPANQFQTGRCWLFAMLNTIRLPLIKKLSLPMNFELSQSYLMFWDKVERTNFFLEAMIETAHEPLDGRLVQFLLSNPIQDAGQWDMACSLVQKYGVLPKDMFPESQSTHASRKMNYIIANKLREFAGTLRTSVADRVPMDDIRAKKADMVKTIHKILMIHLGTPPSSFDWEYTTADKEYCVIEGLTPQSFYRELCLPDTDVMSKISLINDPRNTYYKLYTVDKLNNMVGGVPIRYVNLPSSELKKYAAISIDNNTPVWFGCDASKMVYSPEGIYNDAMFKYGLVYGDDCAPDMDKETRLRYGETVMTHAMVFTAYDQPPGSDHPIKWRVENSYAQANGDKGYMVMTDSWFDEYNFQVAVDIDLLEPELTEILAQDPVVLPAWDPMGALAGNVEELFCVQDSCGSISSKL